MEYKVYVYRDFTWIGPDVNAIGEIIKLDLDDFDIIDEIKYKYYQPHENSQYVILSNFCLLEDTVLGLPRSYTDCFRDIIRCIEDEIYLANQRDGDSGTIKNCLECNKIIPYLKW